MVRDPVIEYIDGLPVMFERDPLTFAKVGGNGDSEDSVMVHPRYVNGIEHELVQVKGYGYGRSLNMVMDSPIIQEGVSYRCKIYKGAGATSPTDDFMIHPTHWFWEDKVKPKETADIHGRTFGAMTSNEAMLEFPYAMIHTLELPSDRPYRVNPFPEELTANIQAFYDTDIEISLAQLVRLARSNIRWDEAKKHLSKKKRTAFLENIIEADTAFIKAHFWFLENIDKSLNFGGQFEANRYVDGSFTDEENFTFLAHDASNNCSYATPASLILQTYAYLDRSVKDHYLEEIEKRTGYPVFTNSKDLIRGRRNFRDKLRSSVMHTFIDVIIYHQLE